MGQPLEFYSVPLILMLILAPMPRCPVLQFPSCLGIWQSKSSFLLPIHQLFLQEYPNYIHFPLLLCFAIQFYNKFAKFQKEKKKTVDTLTGIALQYRIWERKIFAMTLLLICEYLYIQAFFNFSQLCVMIEKDQSRPPRSRALLAIGIADARTLSKANYFTIPCGANVCKGASAFYELY